MSSTAAAVSYPAAAGVGWPAAGKSSTAAVVAGMGSSYAAAARTACSFAVADGLG